MDLSGISLTETDGQVFLCCEPVTGRGAVDVAMLLTLIDQSGFSECLRMVEAITRAANSCNTSGEPFVVQVAERRDAEIQVQIAADEMSAQLSLVPPHGGKPVTVENVQKTLAQAGVAFGIDQAAVVQLCALGRCTQVCIAQGALAQNGQNTVFESLVPQTTDRAPKVGADGLIDYREHGGIVVVGPGQPLMRRTPPTPGVAGHTVIGRELPPQEGVMEVFATELPGTQVASDNPDLLLAAVAGQPVLVKHGVMVEAIFKLTEVNMTTGNVYFDGTVQVTGEVLPGMKVQASGDIIVRGTVDGGLLEAGGNIQIGGGVIAHSHLRAQGAVSARFAENSSIHAGTVIALDDMALECELQSLNQIIIGAKVPQRGRLVGGSATAMMLLQVPLLGSSKGGITRVKVGANPELELQLQELSLRLEKEKAVEENLEKLIKQIGATGDPKGILERVKATWRQALQVWSQSLAEYHELEAQLALTLMAKVEVGAGVSGAVDLAFGRKTFHLQTEFGEGVFSASAESGVVFTNTFGRRSFLDER